MDNSMDIVIVKVVDLLNQIHDKSRYIIDNSDTEYQFEGACPTYEPGLTQTEKNKLCYYSQTQIFEISKFKKYLYPPNTPLEEAINTFVFPIIQDLLEAVKESSSSHLSIAIANEKFLMNFFLIIQLFFGCIIYYNTV